VKFLVDACAGRKLMDWLCAEGHDAIASSTFGRDPGDLQLLRWAVHQKRVLVTLDKDFGHLHFRDGETHHGIIRLPDVPAAQRIGLMREILEQFSASVIEQRVLTVGKGRIRVSG